jgi:gamma-glutamyltranspeptidase/glutathione hydrolase
MFRDRYDGRIPDGLLHTVVPAAPANWIAALARYGTMSFAEVAASAIRFARDGFPTYPFFTEIIAAKQGRSAPGRRRQRSSCPADNPRASVRPSCRPTSRAACNTWRIRNARMPATDAWTGCAPRTTRSTAATSPPRSCATSRRMAACSPRPTWHRLPGQHRAAVPHALRRLRCLRLRRLVAGTDGAGGDEHPGTDGSQNDRPQHPGYIHAVTEALKLAAADREAYFGDPNFVDVPLDVLLSKSYAADRRALFDPARAWPGMPPAGQATDTPLAPWQPDPSAVPAGP